MMKPDKEILRLSNHMQNIAETVQKLPEFFDSEQRIVELDYGTLQVLKTHVREFQKDVEILCEKQEKKLCQIFHDRVNYSTED